MHRNRSEWCGHGGSKMNAVFGTGNPIQVLEPNERRLNLLQFFKFITSVRGGQCDYSPRTPKNQTVTAYKNIDVNLKERDYVGELGVDGKVVLR